MASSASRNAASKEFADDRNGPLARISATQAKFRKDRSAVIRMPDLNIEG